MKLADHVEHIRTLIDTAFRNRLGRMGIGSGALKTIESIPEGYRSDRSRIETIREVLISETGSVSDAYEKLVEEFTFTLFNRIAALKVMEAHTLHPEIITRRPQHGDRAFSHKFWLEQHPEGRDQEIEGLVPFFESQLAGLSGEIPLFSLEHPYHLLPTAIELNSVITAFNAVEMDTQIEDNIWQSDDILGWLYESYNNYKKAAHKASKAKTEYNKVSIQSQVYTPRWVVKFLVDNSLGKLYLEMFPDSEIKHNYKIANAPKTQVRDRKPLTEVKLIDPATGSGNFLLYAFDLFYDLYLDQIENYGSSYDEDRISELIIRHNLYGVDLDDRAIQLAQLGLYIKAKRKKRTAKVDHFNIVSSDFFLPDYEEVKDIFEEGAKLDKKQQEIVRSVWSDLQNAYKFGSLVRLEEKLSIQLQGMADQIDKAQIQLFDEHTIANYDQFRGNFFKNLQRAVDNARAKTGHTFLNTKTQDAITFLELLSQKYDVAVANPPYTDSGDFGADLKAFIDANYKKPYRFNSNLYTAFLKRCLELTNEYGYVALIHPHTFMFIKSFEDVRKFIVEKTSIDLLVDYGLDRVNLFGPEILLDATWYVLSKRKCDSPGLYFGITSNQQEKVKQASLQDAFDDAIHQRQNDRVFRVSQTKLKIIEGWPFIYWISDGFREKFKGKQLKNVFKVAEGMTTADNNRFLRFFWEIDNSDYVAWPYYAKGGPYNKYYGNVWLRINWMANGSEIKAKKGASVRNEAFYFKQGITFSSVGSKGVNYRTLNKNTLFDSASRSVFPKLNNCSVDYSLGLLNSNLALYVASCLNPTVSTTVGDIERVPFVQPNQHSENEVAALVSNSTRAKKDLCSYKVTEPTFDKNAIVSFAGNTLSIRFRSYLNFENAQLTKVLLNDAVINELVFQVYALSDADRGQVETKMGVTVGGLPVTNEARAAYQAAMPVDLESLRNHLAQLPVANFTEERIKAIKAEFGSLYQSNNDLEEFSIRHQVNPINVWYWFKESNVVPQARAAEVALEFLADAIRTILMEDEDGIVPLVGLPGELRLMDRLEQHCLDEGLTTAQFLQLDGLLGRPLNDYLEHHFFSDLSDHLNLFMYLPKTPFIWHLSSGEHKGFEAYIIIYKWNSDSLFKLKSSYLSKRTENLQHRIQTIGDSTSAQAQTEKETIRLQLREIEEFFKKIDGLIAEGYDPKLDDGVGKNIAPLQEKGMLRAEVLNAKQLEKYLNADW